MINICFHNYNPWSKAYDAYSGLRQSSSCYKCGKIRIRSIEVIDKSNSSSWVYNAGDEGKVNNCYLIGLK